MFPFCIFKVYFATIDSHKGIWYAKLVDENFPNEIAFFGLMRAIKGFVSTNLVK